jgi:hypothetical protein
MQITIDDDTFHKWATEHGYVRWSDLTAVLEEASRRVAQKFATPAVNNNPSASGTITWSVQDTAIASTFTEEVASLEQPEDLKPAEPPLTDKQTIRLLGELFEHYGNSPEANKACRALLDRYGAAKASEIPPEHRAELARLVNSRHDYATADEFMASLKP